MERISFGNNPPTFKQYKYAMILGIDLPDGVTFDSISPLIDHARLHKTKDVPRPSDEELQYEYDEILTHSTSIIKTAAGIATGVTMAFAAFCAFVGGLIGMLIGIVSLGGIGAIITAPIGALLGLVFGIFSAFVPAIIGSSIAVSAAKMDGRKGIILILTFLILGVLLMRKDVIFEHKNPPVEQAARSEDKLPAPPPDSDRLRP